MDILFDLNYREGTINVLYIKQVGRCNREIKYLPILAGPRPYLPRYALDTYLIKRGCIPKSSHVILTHAPCCFSCSLHLNAIYLYAHYYEYAGAVLSEID